MTTLNPLTPVQAIATIIEIDEVIEHYRNKIKDLQSERVRACYPLYDLTDIDGETIFHNGNQIDLAPSGLERSEWVEQPNAVTIKPARVLES